MGGDGGLPGSQRNKHPYREVGLSLASWSKIATVQKYLLCEIRRFAMHPLSSATRRTAARGSISGHFSSTGHFSLNWTLFTTQHFFARAYAQGTHACVRRGWRGVYFTPRAGNAPHGRTGEHFWAFSSTRHFSLNWARCPRHKFFLRAACSRNTRG